MVCEFRVPPWMVRAAVVARWSLSAGLAGALGGRYGSFWVRVALADRPAGRLLRAQRDPTQHVMGDGHQQQDAEGFVHAADPELLEAPENMGKMPRVVPYPTYILPPPVLSQCCFSSIACSV